MNRFCTNILLPKKLQSQTVSRKKLCKTLSYKKLLLRCWWNWHLVFEVLTLLPNFLTFLGRLCPYLFAIIGLNVPGWFRYSRYTFILGSYNEGKLYIRGARLFWSRAKFENYFSSWAALLEIHKCFYWQFLTKFLTVEDLYVAFSHNRKRSKGRKNKSEGRMRPVDGRTERVYKGVAKNLSFGIQFNIHRI